MIIELEDPATPDSKMQLVQTHGFRGVRVHHHHEPLLESVRTELIELCNDRQNECCGFIDREWEVWHVPNSHNFPRRNYFMCEDDVVPVLNEIYNVKNSDIVAIWHTHPNGVPWPSPRDICGWPNPLLNWRYFVVIHNDVIEWKLVKNVPANITH